MGESFKQVRVFVVAPEDVQAEYKQLEQIIQELNRSGGAAAQYRCVLQLTDWLDVTPGMGDSRERLQDSLPVGSWDIFIGILWARFDNGATAQDVKAAFEAAYDHYQQYKYPHILFYKCTRPMPYDFVLSNLDAISELKAFWTEFEMGGKHPGLFKSFVQIKDFDNSIRHHLITLLKNINPPLSPPKKFKPIVEESGELSPTDIEWVRYDVRAIKQFATDVSALTHINVDDKMAILRFLKDYKLVCKRDEVWVFTKVGALLFGPQARLMGVALTDVKVEYGPNISKPYEGTPLMRLLYELQNELRPLWEDGWQDAANVDAQGHRSLIPFYPQEAIREALVNFIIHRDYDQQAEAWIAIREDSIEMVNAGNSSFDVEALLSGSMLRPTYQRNNHLINTFYRIKTNERQGGGFKRIIEYLLQNGNVFDDGSPALEITNDTIRNRFSVKMYKRRPPIIGQSKAKGMYLPARANPIVIKELHRMMMQSFKFEELVVFSFYLGVSNEELGNPSHRSNFVVELIRFMQRRNTLPKLLHMLKVERPDVIWPSVEQLWLPTEENPDAVQSQVKEKYLSSKINSIELKKLKQKMIRAFKFEELMVFSFYLGVSNEELGNPSHRSNFVEELISFMQRRNILPKLLHMLKAERPDVIWPSVEQLWLPTEGNSDDATLPTQT